MPALNTVRRRRVLFPQCRLRRWRPTQKSLKLSVPSHDFPVVGDQMTSFDE